jgi:ABC-type sugar transport system permease subunit
MRRRERIWLVLPLALLVFPFLLLPLLLGLFESLTNYGPLQPHPQFVGLANYAAVFRTPDFAASWRNILIMVTVAVPLELAIGIGLGYLLREPFRGRAFLRVVFLLPWLVSPIANGAMWHFLLSQQVGMLSYFAAWFGMDFYSPLASVTWALPTAIATDVWRNAPFACFLLFPGLLAIPPELWEFATLEGASVFAQIRYIVLPWLMPLLLAVALLLVGSTLGTFDDVLILTGGGPGSATVTPALYSYLQAFQFALWPAGVTAAWLIVASMILIALVYLRLTRVEAAA